MHWTLTRFFGSKNRCYDSGGIYTKTQIREQYKKLRKELKDCATVVLGIDQPHPHKHGRKAWREYIITVKFKDEADEAFFIMKNIK